MLSGDFLAGCMPVMAPDELAPFNLGMGPETPVLEEILAVGEDGAHDSPSHQSYQYDPSQELTDIFSGLSEKDPFSDQESGDAISEGNVWEDPASDVDVSLLNHAVSEGEKADIVACLPPAEEATPGKLVGPYEILNDTLSTSVYDYFSDATDPPTTDGIPEAFQAQSAVSDSRSTIDDLTVGYDSAFIRVNPDNGVPREDEVRLEPPRDSSYFHPTIKDAQTITLMQGEITVFAEDLVVDENDTLTGSGEIVGDVFNLGVISPGNSPGSITVNGDLTITGGSETRISPETGVPFGPDISGKLHIEIAGIAPGQYDQITVTGNTTITNGTLEVELINGFIPAAGNTFTFLTSSTLTGSFTDAIGLFGFGDGSLFFDIEQNGGTLTLVVEETPGDSDLLINPITQSSANIFGKVLSDYFPISTADLATQVVYKNGNLDALLTGVFHFSKQSDEVIGTVTSLSALLFRYNDLDVLELDVSGSGAILLNAQGAAAHVSLNATGTNSSLLDMTGGSLFEMNTTGTSISQIGDLPVALTGTEPLEDIARLTVDTLLINLSVIVSFEATNTVFDLTATGSEPYVTFGGNPDTGDGGVTIGFDGGAIFDNWTGSAGNFSIGADFSIFLLDGFYTLVTGPSDTGLFGLPIPIEISELGFKYGEGAIENGKLIRPDLFTLRVSGGLNGESPIFPIVGMVDGLEVDLALLAAGEFPIVNLEGFQFGIKKVQIGPVTVGGIFTFGLVTITNNAGEEVRAFYGGIEGAFEYSDIGGGIKLYVCQYGPLMATISAGGLVEPTTGFVFGFEDGGFAWGGAAWPSIDDARELLENEVFYEPMDTSLDSIKARVEYTLQQAELQKEQGIPVHFTWNDSFTMAATGTVTNLYVQGMISGDVTIAANIEMPTLEDPVPAIKYLVNGNINVLGISLGWAGMLMDFTNSLAPRFDIAFSVPSPGCPIGFLFPSEATFLASLDTEGVIEMPLVGLAVFIQELASGTMDVAIQNLLNPALDRIAEEQESDHEQPLAQIILDIDDNDEVSATEDAMVIDRDLIIDRLIGDPNEGIVALLPVSFAAIETLSVDKFNNAIGMVTQLLPALFLEVMDFDGDDWAAFGLAFAEVVVNAFFEGAQAAWEIFNPSLTIHGQIQPILFGIPIGRPTFDAELTINKRQIVFDFEGSLSSQLLNMIVGSALGPIGSALPPGLIGIADDTRFSVTLDLPDELVTALLSIHEGANDELLALMSDAINPFSGWEIFLASTAHYWGFKLGSLSGFIFGPQDPNNKTPLFESQVVLLDQNGDGNPDQGPLDLVTNDYNLIPVATQEQYANIMEYGGILMTGQLFMPDIIRDPISVVTTLPEPASATVVSSDGAFELFIESMAPAAEFNDVIIEFVAGEVPGTETAVYDESDWLRKVLRITVVDDVTTTADVIAVLEAEGTFTGSTPAGKETVRIDLDTLPADPIITSDGINGIDWTLPDVNFSNLLEIPGDIEKVKDYVDQIFEGLTRQSEWAKLQIYIASPAKLFQIDNYLNPTTQPGEDKVQVIDVTTLGETAIQELKDILSAGYIEGYAELTLLGFDLGDAFIEGSITGVAAEVEIPWLAGLQARLDTGTRQASVGETLYDLVTSPLIAPGLHILLGEDPADEFDFLLIDELTDIIIDYPVAAFEGEYSSDRVFEWLEHNLGFPANVITAATDNTELTIWAGLYTPGYGGPDDIGVKRNGGYRLEIDLDITGLVDDAAFVFEIQPFSALQNGVLIPNFLARASVTQLGLQGLESTGLFNAESVLIEIRKDDAGLQMLLNGDITFLGLAYEANGEFNIDSEGIYGVILITLVSTDMSAMEVFGFTLEGELRIEVNLTSGPRTVSLSLGGVPTEVVIEHGVRINIVGELAFLDSIKLIGEFYFVMEDGDLYIGLRTNLVAEFTTPFGDLRLFEFPLETSEHAKFMKISEEGTAATFQLSPGVDDIVPLSEYGVNLAATFFFTVNTTSELVHIIFDNFDPVLAYGLNEEEQNKLNAGEVVHS